MRKYRKLSARCYRVLGEKALKFLHGQLTNSLTDLPVGSVSPNLLLNPKGQIQGEVWVWHLQDEVLLVLDPEHEVIVLDHLKKLAPLSFCQIEACDPNFRVYHVLDSENVFMGLSEAGQAASVPEGRAGRTDRWGEPGCDVLVTSDHQESWLKTLQEKSYEILSDDELSSLRHSHHVPLIGRDTTEKTLPQEARLERALHFDKGCYLGQEIVARLKYRGKLKKQLYVVEDESQELQEGQTLEIAGKTYGPVTSVVQNRGFCTLPIQLVESAAQNPLKPYRFL